MPQLRSRLRAIGCLFASLAVTVASHTARADDEVVPKPNPYPISWELDFKHGMPKRVVVDTPDSSVPQAYWYLTYHVTNHTDREQNFLPQFDLLADNGQVTRADVNLPKRVFDIIQAREHNKYLVPITKAMGTLRIGDAEAVDSVAIWPEPEPRMGKFSIFVTGLSGEAVTLKPTDGKLVKVTNADELKDKAGLIFLRKTLQLNFFIRGDEVYPGEDEVNKDSETWIMR